MKFVEREGWLVEIVDISEEVAKTTTERKEQ
jgi:hypothetical protein